MKKSSHSDTPPASSAISVVVVEDDASIAEMLVTWIGSAEGFQCVQVFSDAESAILELPRLKPNIALVDINLPGMSGVECVKTLKPVLQETQFVVLTVYADSTHIFNALSGGATGYLLKHTKRNALLSALREVHEGGSPMSSIIARKVVQALQPQKPKSSPTDCLSARENEVLSLLAQGYLYKEIAERMCICLPTVNSYIRRIYEKLQVQSRSQAVAILTDFRTKV